MPMTKQQQTNFKAEQVIRSMIRLLHARATATGEAMDRLRSEYGTIDPEHIEHVDDAVSWSDRHRNWGESTSEIVRIEMTIEVAEIAVAQALLESHGYEVTC